MGTLFERGLDPGKRSQLGAHYTDAEKIMMIVRPVIIEPLLREWQTARDEIEAKLAQAKAGKSAGTKTKAKNEAEALRIAFIERLKNFRVLDPACGSGNFLYLALKSLKDIEARVNIEAESLGLPPAFPSVGPECVKGIEINPFAAELARVSVWIGEIQWMREKGFGVSKNPILKSLDTIECRDALLNPDGSEAEWPEADVIIGNPPFLGRTFLRESLGDIEAKRLFTAFEDVVPAESDLVCYWVTKAWQMCEIADQLRVGLVTTNSIRGGANRRALDPIAGQSAIFHAWSDEPWVVDGASVRVSIVCFGQSENRHQLDGIEVDAINSDLTSAHFDTTTSIPLPTNVGLSFQGPVLVGDFDVSRSIAEKWLSEPKNPNSRANSEVLRPIRNGKDINARPRDFWVINFGNLEEREAALFQGPFEHVVRHVKDFRTKSKDRQRREYWWRLGRSGQSFFQTSKNLVRYIATSQVSKHRFFVWLSPQIQPHQTVIAIARDDDTTFGILHSKFHELWSLRLGTSLEDRPRYTPTTCFETFPFPEGLTPNILAAQYASDPRAIAIAKAAARLNELRENWLNPPDLVMRVPEVVPGYPDRILPVDAAAAAILKNRTLTKLYNERPAWLDHAHKDLDSAVASAYGWPADLTDEQILEKLFALNQERAAKQSHS